MTRWLLQAVGLFFLGSLLVQQASAGTTAPSAQFNTFSFADAPLQPNGVGGSIQTGMLSTTFTIDGDPATVNIGGFSLMLQFPQPGISPSGPTPPANLMNLAGCTLNSPSSCMFSGVFSFDSDNVPIQPGTTFTAMGTLSYHGTTLATSQDSFAAVPEPSVLALLAIGLAGLGLTRRKTAR